MKSRTVSAVLLMPFLCLMEGCHTALALQWSASYTVAGPEGRSGRGRRAVQAQKRAHVSFDFD
jgi:hypothetical protein